MDAILTTPSQQAFQPPLSSQQNPPLPDPHSLAPPLARPDRPMTAALSVSDYGEWLDDACAAPPAALPSPGGRTEGESIHFGAPPGVAAYSSSVEVEQGAQPSPTLTPRKATFAMAQQLQTIHGPHAAKEPVRYGYL